MNMLGIHYLEYEPIHTDGSYLVIEPDSILAMEHVFPINLGGREYSTRDALVKATQEPFKKSNTTKLTEDETASWLSWGYSIAVAVANQAIKHQEFRQSLLETHGNLVERSKNKIWGNGLNPMSDQLGTYHGFWGHALMTVRATLQAEAPTVQPSHLQASMKKSMPDGKTYESKIKNFRVLNGDSVWNYPECRIEFFAFYNLLGEERVLRWVEETRSEFLNSSDFVYSLPTNEVIRTTADQIANASFATIDVPIDSLIKCPKCQGCTKTTLKQTRSADESAIPYAECLNPKCQGAKRGYDKDGNVVIQRYEFRITGSYQPRNL